MRYFLAYLLLPLSALAAEPQLPLSDDTYEVSWREYELGDGQVTLEKSTRANCYRYRSVTNPIGLVKMFYGSPSESSEFCVEGGRVRPRHFEFNGKGDDSYTLDFDWKKRKLRGGTLPERALLNGSVDHFSIQQAVRLWVMSSSSKKNPGTLKLTLAEKNGESPYTFAIRGRETIEVPAGSFNCLRVELVGHERKKINYWIAPDRDWSLVKLEHIKDKKQQLMLVLK